MYRYSADKLDIAPEQNLGERIFLETNTDAIGYFNRSVKLFYIGYYHPTEMEITGTLTN